MYIRSLRFGVAAKEVDATVATSLQAVAARARMGADVAGGLRSVAERSTVPAHWERLAVCWQLAPDTRRGHWSLMQTVQRDIVERERFSTRVARNLTTPPGLSRCPLPTPHPTTHADHPIAVLLKKRNDKLRSEVADLRCAVREKLGTEVEFDDEVSLRCEIDELQHDNDALRLRISELDTQLDAQRTQCIEVEDALGASRELVKKMIRDDNSRPGFRPCGRIRD